MRLRLQNIVCLWLLMLLCSAGITIVSEGHCNHETAVVPLRQLLSQHNETAASFGEFTIASIAATPPPSSGIIPTPSAANSAESITCHGDYKLLSAARTLPGRPRIDEFVCPPSKRVPNSAPHPRPSDYYVYSLERILI